MSRDSFGSRFGALVAMAGSAVGLGNLWRFPYLVGENGGAAFIIIYIILSFLICLPIFSHNCFYLEQSKLFRKKFKKVFDTNSHLRFNSKHQRIQ